MAQLLTFDFYNSIIEVPIPDVTLEMQYLIDQIRNQEDELTAGIQYSKIADASGKESLGAGIYTAITIRLLDNWRVRFQARPGSDTVQCTLSAGNLVGGPGGNPIAPSAYTQVVALSSAAGTISTPTTSSENVNLRYLLASMSGAQKGIGNVYYWDPVSGSDSNSGLAPTAAVATFAQAQSLATAGNNDIIFCLSSDPSGVTTVTETINITKNTLRVKGPGHIFQFVPTLDTSDTVTISANDVEFAGFYVSTAATGTKNAISITGDRANIKDCWVSTVRGNGINISSSSLSKIDTSVIEHCGTSGTGNGINISDTTSQLMVVKCIIFDNVNGATLSGTGVTDNIIEDSLIYKNSGYGVNIGTGVTRTTLRSGNTITKNTTSNTLDGGIDSYIETPAGGASATEIADSVWDEVISSHATAGTAGKVLSQAKAKATLASLK
jgi:hypothetical protein